MTYLVPVWNNSETTAAGGRLLTPLQITRAESSGENFYKFKTFGIYVINDLRYKTNNSDKQINKWLRCYLIALALETGICPTFVQLLLDDDDLSPCWSFILRFVSFITTKSILRDYLASAKTAMVIFPLSIAPDNGKSSCRASRGYFFLNITKTKIAEICSALFRR